MTSLWRQFCLALGFLTRLPAAVRMPVGPTELGRSMTFFPLVGLLLGGLLVAADALFTLLLPRLVGDALLLVVLVLATGALHLDGLADLSDGVGSGRDRDTALQIMKDSSIGAFGAIALCLYLLVKFLALASLPPAAKPAALLLAPVAGRWAPVLLAVTLPYLRGPAGTGAAFADHAGRRELLLATLTLLAVSVALFHWQGLVLAGVLASGGLLFAAWARRRLGGATGDLFGAGVELLELLALLLVLGLIHREV